MTVRILEIACISTPRGCRRRLHHPSASLLRFAEDFIDLIARGNIMGDAKLRGTDRTKRGSCILCQAFSRPKRQGQPILKTEEGYDAVLDLGPDNPFTDQA